MKASSKSTKLCSVVIPLYKSTPSESEIIALTQCLTVLGKYDIVFVTYKELNRSIYENVCAKMRNENFRFIYFPRQYFDNIWGYNTLMLARFFYEQFLIYDYILIYQLDAWVFADQLEYWCAKQYDYIGAPWLEYRKDLAEVVPLYDISVGNGGFSLRKVRTFFDMCSLFWVSLWRFYNYRHATYKSFVPIFLRKVFRRIMLLFYRDKNTCPDNEDVIFSYMLSRNRKKTPSWQEAMHFSFEAFPEHTFKLTGGKLPFGAHALESYDKLAGGFWSKILPHLRGDGR